VVPVVRTLQALRHLPIRAHRRQSTHTSGRFLQTTGNIAFPESFLSFSHNRHFGTAGLQTDLGAGAPITLQNNWGLAGYRSESGRSGRGASRVQVAEKVRGIFMPYPKFSP